MSKILPTKKEFQSLANDIKIESNITRCQAYEKLAKQYGYKTYHDIKPFLHDTKASVDLTSIPGIEIITCDEFYKIQKEQMFNEASKASTYFKPYHQFKEQMLIDGIAYEPKLPNEFWNTPNEDRDFTELENWWDVAFIVNNGNGYFIVYMLDGGAWDRPTRKGTFNKFEDALELAQSLNNIEITDKDKYITLSTGAVVNNGGIIISSNGELLIEKSLTSSNLINLNAIDLSKKYIEENFEKRKNINHKLSSYKLKELVEKHYKEFISNGSFIVALDQLEFKLYEDSINVYTNIKK